jgi:thiol:disulfide interchange protein
MKRLFSGFLPWLAVAGWASAPAQTADLPARSPFGIAVAATNGVDGIKILKVDFTVPAECVLYFDRLHFRTTDGGEIQPLKIPKPGLETDRITGKPRKVFGNDFSAEIKYDDLPDHQLAVKFQGCTNDACFFPEQRLFAQGPAGTFIEVTANPPTNETPASIAAPAVDWTNAFRGFAVKAQQTGYLDAAKFTAFLDHSVTSQGATNPAEQFEKAGLVATLLLIILGGFLLNFTPCVLPMIPVNLAIIGAGNRARSRADGFRKGAIYGSGMALSYGTVGLVVVLTGAKFGTLNSSPWFNLGIACVFVLMALGMFEVLNIDLSRFSHSGLPGSAARSALAESAVVCAMGVMSALLAGACVAPVVITVVLLAANLYAKGALAGLALPFLLGAGMALPWPLAGAGLAFLPKPGKWMKKVKFAFGTIIVAFAAYYGFLAWQTGRTLFAMHEASIAIGVAGQSDTELLSAIQQARATGKPLFIDFHASWCKDCSAMDETVFNRSEVKGHLSRFISVRYAAEQPNSPPAKPLLDHFQIVGLPTYLVLSPLSISTQTKIQ